MKKLILLTFFGFLFLFVGCTEEADKPLQIDMIETTIVEEGLKVVLRLNLGELENEEITKVGLLYGEVEQENLTFENMIGKEELIWIDNKEKSDYEICFSSIGEKYYNKTLALQPFLVLENGVIKYSINVGSVVMYELAKQIDNIYANFIVSVVEERVLEEIKIVADYQKYTVETIGNGYKATLKTDYNFIKITISLEENYLLRDSFMLIINEKIIEQNKYQQDGLNIIYQIDDPNWTNPY